MPWTEFHTDLNYLLAGLYFNNQDARRVGQAAGVNVLMIDYSGNPLNFWNSQLNMAINQGKVNEIIEAALKDNPGHPELLAAQKGTLIKNKNAPEIGKTDQDPSWKGGELNEENLEKRINEENTFLPIGFLEMGTKKARSVARLVKYNKLHKAVTYGTGFMITDDLLLTNNHVIGSADEAKTFVAEFNYQEDIDYRPLEIETYELDPDGAFATSDKFEDDWTVVKLKKPAGEKWGNLELDEREVEVNERVSIIQHPGGAPKQICMHNNFVQFVNEDRLQYITDTLEGSSGSPVFDMAWNVVALHHAGGHIPEPKTKKKFFRNEGIHINKVLKGISKAGIAL